MSPTQTDSCRWYALAMLCAANFMVILDGTIVFVAMPSIQQDLEFSGGSAQWVMTAYGLVFGGLLLLCGRTGDLLGRRRLFMAGAVLFAASSLFCGLAWSPEVLIGARAAQGLSAAVMSPTALSLVMITFTEGSERNKALAIWGATGGFGGTAGSLIGGPLTDGLGWEWIFYINVPIGLAMLALSPVLLHESRDRVERRRFDLAGAVTITAGLIAGVYATVHVPEVGWLDAQTLALLAAAAVLIALFLVIESRSEAPLVPLRIFRSPVLLGGNVTLLAIGMSTYGMIFTLTAYAQGVLGFSAVRFGLMTAVMAGTAALSSFIAEAMCNRGGPRLVAVISLAFTGVGLALLTQVSAGGSYLGDIFWGLLIFAPGLGAGFVAGVIASLMGVEERDAGLASGLTNTSWQVGGVLGISILTTVALSRTDDLVSDPGQAASPAALTEGYQSAFTAAVAFAVVGLVAVFFLLRRPRTGPVKDEVTSEPAVTG